MNYKNCANLKYDDYYQRYAGHLHLPEGKIPVYLEPNTKQGKLEPAFFIKDLRSSTTLGMFHKQGIQWSGQLSTRDPIALVMWVSATGSYVIKVNSEYRARPRYPVILNFVQYDAGERYKP